MTKASELPPALARARPLLIVLYADIQEARAGHAPKVAARVLRRARVLQALLILGGAILLGPRLWLLASGEGPELTTLALHAFALGTGFLALHAVTAGLVELSASGDPSGESSGESEPNTTEDGATPR